MRAVSRLQFLTYGECRDSVEYQVDAVCRAGIDWIQLRVKGISFSEWIRLAKRVRSITTCFGATLIINDSVEVARLVKADGVHLGQSDTSISLARRMLGPNAIIGGTANTCEEIKSCAHAGADYIGLGPYKFTKTKAALSPVLGDEIRQVISEARGSGVALPIVAIGGIEKEDIPKILTHGASGVAVSSGIAGAESISEAAADFLNYFKVESYGQVGYCRA